ncbi:MAG: response regulator, partial [Firmicutes bacterium]|nr:response regulator [Candidatus Scybalomonas excrementavium]
MYRIMLIEDDQTIALAMKKFLESWNYKIICVEDFKDILGVFQRENPDLILMDLMLPYFNGFYWCEEIRKYSKVPIMFVSSASDNMNIVMAMSAGADDFIVKPVELTVLV